MCLRDINPKNTWNLSLHQFIYGRNKQEPDNTLIIIEEGQFQWGYTFKLTDYYTINDLHEINHWYYCWFDQTPVNKLDNLFSLYILMKQTQSV